MRFLYISALVLGITVSVFAQSAVLDSYVGVAQGLAADDLSAAKKAATGLESAAKADKQTALASAASKIASSESLDAARESFKAASADAVKLADGKKGFYVFTCPMAHADWVQKTKETANPYFGKSMADCGVLKTK
jgi:hypothetical protein